MIINRRTRITLALAALVGFAWGPVLGLPADADSSSPPSWARGLPPCEYEDGSGGPLPCYWDAGDMGNGVGKSYIIRADDSTAYCLVTVSGRRIRVRGYGDRPGTAVTVRVNGRLLRGKLGPRGGAAEFRVRGRYSAGVRARVKAVTPVPQADGFPCETVYA